MLDDLFKLTGSVANTALHSASEAKKQMDIWAAERLSDLLKDYDFVTREEFEVVQSMAQEARKENIALKKQLDALSKKSPSPKPKSSKK